jgi:hypothetical protein
MTLSRRVCSLWSFALAAALLTAQWANQLHGFDHVRYELALAEYTAAAQAAPAAASQPGGKENLPGLGHSLDRCIAFQAFDCVSVSTTIPILASAPSFFPIVEPGLSLRPANYPPFSARAPPVLC